MRSKQESRAHFRLTGMAARRQCCTDRGQMHRVDGVWIAQRSWPDASRVTVENMRHS
jgi:hypothetical protein